MTNIGDDTNQLELDDIFWLMYFDGAKTQEGSGEGCILIDPNKNKHFLSCRLEFECTNNTTKYEALVLGLKKAIEIKVRNLKVFGDSEIVVRQVRNTIHCLSPHLKGYQLEVWNLIVHFNAFNINVVPRLQNDAPDLLATSACRLVPTNNNYFVELIFRPSVPNNVTNMRVFDDNEYIIYFLTNEESFKESIIDEEEHLASLQMKMKFKEIASLKQ